MENFVQIHLCLLYLHKIVQRVYLSLWQAQVFLQLQLNDNQDQQYHHHQEQVDQEPHQGHQVLNNQIQVQHLLLQLFVGQLVALGLLQVQVNMTVKVLLIVQVTVVRPGPDLVLLVVVVVVHQVVIPIVQVVQVVMVRMKIEWGIVIIR